MLIEEIKDGEIEEGTLSIEQDKDEQALQLSMQWIMGLTSKKSLKL